MSAMPSAISEPLLQRAAAGGWGVETVTDGKDLERLRPEWERLWAEDAAADVFASFDWFCNWWRHFGRKKSEAALVVRVRGELAAVPGIVDSLAVCVARDAGGRAAAILPLVRVRGLYRGRKARLLSTPVNSHAPRTGLMCAADGEARLLDALARHIAAQPDYDALLLDGLCDAGSRFDTFARGLAAAGLSAGERGRWSHSYLRFEGGWEEFFAARGRHFRKGLGQTERALEKLGALTAERHGGAEAATEGLALFLAIDSASWKAGEGEIVEAHSALRAYYGELCDRFARQGRAEVWVLRVGGAPAAAFLCLAAKNTCYTLKTSFDKRLSSSRRSPSHVLLGRMISGSWSGGRCGMDFVGKLPFVERWANAETGHAHMTFYRRSAWAWRARLGDATARLVRRARASAARVRARLARRGGEQESTG